MRIAAIGAGGIGGHYGACPASLRPIFQTSECHLEGRPCH